MIQLRKDWLAGLPWEGIEAIHQELCQGKQLGIEPNPTGIGPAKALWASACEQQQTFYEALEICRRCLVLQPFVFLNANTMAAAARKLVEDGLANLHPVEAQIIRTTISHYVAGRIPKKELEQVLKHFENAWLGNPVPAPQPAPPPQATLAPREFPRAVG